MQKLWPPRRDEKYLRLAKQAGLTGRAGARLASALESAGKQYDLRNKIRPGALGERAKSDARILSEIAKRTIDVKRALGLAKYPEFVRALDSLTWSGLQALNKQGATPFLVALRSLPAAFEQFAKHAEAAAEVRAAAARALPARARGAPRIAENRTLLVDHLRRLARSHSRRRSGSHERCGDHVKPMDLRPVARDHTEVG
jgi:hypothetical protein